LQPVRRSLLFREEYDETTHSIFVSDFNIINFLYGG